MLENKTYQRGNYSLEYAIDYPEDYKEGEKYPVVFYFHGMGREQPVRRERMTPDMPLVIVSPMCPDYMWLENLHEVKHFIEYIIAQTFADEKRIYLTGTSMGGYTSWTLSVLYPGLFTAAVICCGGGPYYAAANITFPVRAVHGTVDDIVLTRESEVMVEKINAAGGHAELVLMEGYDHSIWEETFSNHDTYRWLLQFSK